MPIEAIAITQTLAYVERRIGEAGAVKLFSNQILSEAAYKDVPLTNADVVAILRKDLFTDQFTTFPFTKQQVLIVPIHLNKESHFIMLVVDIRDPA